MQPTNTAGEPGCWWPCCPSLSPRQRAQLLVLVALFASSPSHPPMLLVCKVYDGENTSSRLLGNFTRDLMLGHIINSTSNRLWLEFNSNASGTNQGFRLTYTSESSSGGFGSLLFSGGDESLAMGGRSLEGLKSPR